MASDAIIFRTTQPGGARPNTGSRRHCAARRPQPIEEWRTGSALEDGWFGRSALLPGKTAVVRQQPCRLAQSSGVRFDTGLEGRPAAHTPQPTRGRREKRARPCGRVGRGPALPDNATVHKVSSSGIRLPGGARPSPREGASRVQPHHKHLRQLKTQSLRTQSNTPSQGRSPQHRPALDPQTPKGRHGNRIYVPNRPHAIQPRRIPRPVTMNTTGPTP